MNLPICVKIKKMLQVIYICNKINIHSRYLFADYNQCLTLLNIDYNQTGNKKY